ncbi:MAG: ATPase inhibitor subunit zeta [Kiloniellales bacterium]
MSKFDERERGFEAKWKRDQELGAAVAQAYAKTVVAADFEGPGEVDVLQKVLADFAKHGIEMTEHRLRKEMGRLMDEAAQQVEAEAAEG